MFMGECDIAQIANLSNRNQGLRADILRELIPCPSLALRVSMNAAGLRPLRSAEQTT
jgi:hypothetical protein